MRHERNLHETAPVEKQGESKQIFVLTIPDSFRHSTLEEAEPTLLPKRGCDRGAEGRDFRGGGA